MCSVRAVLSDADVYKRQPLNDRYQQREGGKTRKSAASAKPATKAASSVYIADPNAKMCIRDRTTP